jgi:SAM-dependent methyltransferase
MGDDVPGFYDDLAEDYHVVLGDWEAAVERQAALLDPLLRALGVPAGGRILDAACGIGTQALGLAARGFAVQGADLSAGAVARARREARARGLDVGFSVMDMRRPEGLDGGFDAAVAFDNAIAHMLDDDDLVAALGGLAGCVRPGGVVAVSVRPYDALRAERPAGMGPRVSGPAGARIAFVQIWDWDDDGRTYRLDSLVLREAEAWRARVQTTTLRALGREELCAAFVAARLRDVRWHGAADTGYHQPIVSARRAS